MKKLILILAAAALLPAAAPAGEIARGSVPGSLNYQGRLERDNAPITGTIHLYFRVFNSATASNSGGAACGAVSQPCLWESPEITVQAAQGIFSADITPPVTVLAGGQSLYLEVQVESDTLSPREPLNSVAYALVAKKLEDGADVLVSTLSATYNVSLATGTGAVMTVGTDTPAGGARLTLNGWLKINSGGIIFPDNSSMNVASVASAGNIANDFDADILADRDSSGGALGGDVVVRKPTLQFMRITNSGNVGIGPSFTNDGGAFPPNGLVDIDGALNIGNEGLYDRDDGEVNIKEDLLVEGGRVTGMNSEYISIGESNNIIALISGGAERARIHSNGFLGVGTNSPAVSIHSSGDIAADAGVRGGRVSIGDYSTWTNLLNEVRAEDAYNLLLQQTNPYNVGVGTDTPREKLHVRGSVRADYGVIAATAAFSGNVQVNGVLNANSKQGNTVELSSTVIYGTLQVTGGIGSQAGIPAYLNSTQTLTGQNTFLNQVVVSSDIITINRMGAGVSDFDFAGTKYLQVGDNKPEFANDNALAYLVGGSNANAKLNFYRGPTLGATLETQGASNLALVVGGQTKTLTDSVYHRVQNSVVWISTGYNTTPAIFISSSLGNVGMGTSVMDPNWRLTVAGNLRIDGSGNGIIFADGTTLNSAGSIGSATSISANGDAVVQSNADLSGGGDVILRAGSLDGLVLNTGGYVGIGTLAPASKLNLRGGDLLLGAPYNPYSSDSVEDLVVAGNIAFDGELVQRSALPVKFSELIVAEDVYLSTSGTGLTGINTLAPVTKLDVNGNAQFGSGVTKSTFAANGALSLAVDLTVANGGTGASTFTDGGILFGNGTAALGATAVLANGELLIGDGTQEPAVATLTGTANQVNVTNGAGSITLSLPQNIHTGADPTFNSLTLTTDLTVANGGTGAGTFTDGGILFGNGTAALGATAVLANGELLIGDGTQEPAVATLTGTANQVNVTNGAGSITLSLPQNIHSGASPTFTAVTASSSGTFRAAGPSQYSVETTSGIKVNNGVVDLTGGKVVNVGAPTYGGDAANKTYVDNATGGGGAWGLLGNDINDALNFIGTTGINDDLVFKTVSLERLRIADDGTFTLQGLSSGLLKVSGLGVLSGGNAVALGSEVSGTLPVGNGGTGATTLTGFVRGNGTGAFTASAIADSDVPDTITLTNITQITNRAISDTTGTLAVSRGGTGATTLTGVLHGNGTGAVTAGNVALGSEVSGTLPVSNGGTGATTLTGVLHGNGTGAVTAGNVALGSEVSGTLSVSNGGTGQTSLTAGRVLVGNGTSAVSLVNGVTANYTVVVDTFPYTCSEFQFTNGVLTNVVAGTCP